MFRQAPGCRVSMLWRSGVGQPNLVSSREQRASSVLRGWRNVAKLGLRLRSYLQPNARNGIGAVGRGLSVVELRLRKGVGLTERFVARAIELGALFIPRSTAARALAMHRPKRRRSWSPRALGVVSLPVTHRESEIVVDREPRVVAVRRCGRAKDRGESEPGRTPERHTVALTRASLG